MSALDKIIAAYRSGLITEEWLVVNAFIHIGKGKPASDLSQLPGNVIQKMIIQCNGLTDNEIEEQFILESICVGDPESYSHDKAMREQHMRLGMKSIRDNGIC